MLISRSDEAAYLDRIRQITEERDELRKKVEDIQAAQKRKRIAAYVTVSLCVVCALSVLLAALLTPYLHIRHNSVLFEGELSKIFYNGWYYEPYTGAVLPDNARKHSFEKGRGASYETVYLHALEDQPFFGSLQPRRARYNFRDQLAAHPGDHNIIRITGRKCVQAVGETKLHAVRGMVADHIPSGGLKRALVDIGGDRI